MPFDGRDNTPALNRARLIEALRAEMPRDWRWDFGNCGAGPSHCGTAGCAIGLAYKLGIATNEDIYTTLGITQEQAISVFSVGAYDIPYQQVTPSMVADRLERIA
jgi:hypothetical protein